MADFNPEEFKDNEAFQTYLQEQLEPLTKTRDGLLVDIAKLKGQVKAFDDVDIDALKEAQRKLADFESKKKDKETEAERALRIAKEQHDQELGELKTSVNTLMAANKTLIVDDALRAQLVAAKVKPELIPSVMKMIKPDVSILTEEGKQVAKVGDKSIGDYVSGWVDSDVGKHFVSANINSGGGGGGGGGGNAPSQDSHAKFFDKNNAEYNVSEQIRLQKANPNLHNTLKSLYK